MSTDDTAAFKNFHRSLCARFGYCHDEKDWRRDLCSLEEHIAYRAVGKELVEHLFKMRDRHSRAAWDEIQGTEEWALQSALCRKVEEVLDFVKGHAPTTTNPAEGH